MHIKQIQILNFQKHSKLNLTFNEGVNIIYGSSDAGKSTIIRAITWVYFNEPKGDVIRKEGSKKTSVKITQDNNVVIERIKSKTINAYILTIPGQEPKRFDSIGKDIPEEILKATQIKPIEVDKESMILNISKQLSMPFLLDKSGSFRMKLFNKMTGNDITDKVFQSLNKDILHIGREEKHTEELLSEWGDKLIVLNTEKEALNLYHNQLENKVKKIKELNTKYEFIIENINKLKELEVKIIEVDNKLSQIKTLPDLDLKSLEIKIDKLEKLNQVLVISDKIKDTLIQLENIKEVKIDINSLRTKADKIIELQKTIKTIKDIDTKVNTLDSTIKDLDSTIKEENKRYKDLLLKCKICPICKKTIEEKDIKEI